MIVEIGIVCASVLIGLGMWLTNRNGKWADFNKKLDEQNMAISIHIKSVRDLEENLLHQKGRIDDLMQRESKKALRGITQ